MIILQQELELAGRLAGAALLGGLIGLERETHSRPAGFRTHMIVALGSCLVMLVSMYMAELSPLRSDPGRIAAQVVTGIGFLGAGAILRFGMSVKGLTTAATLWTTAGIGLAVGCGYWAAAGVTTALTLVVLFVFDKFEKAFFKGRASRKIVIHAKDGPGLVDRVEEIMEKSGVALRKVDIRRDVVERKIEVSIRADFPRKTDVEGLSRAIGSLPEMEKVEIE